MAGPDELFRYHYSHDYYARPDRTGTEVSRPPITTVNAAAIAHPQLASPRFTNAPANHALAFPPLSAASARGGTGVSLLLLRRHGQPGFIEATWWNFTTDAVAYFADCPALATELQANRYHARNLPQLVRRYNSCPAPGRP